MALRYNSSSTTTNIFYYDANNADHLRNLPLRLDVPSYFILPVSSFAHINNPPTILSSCAGLIACRNTTTNTYYVGNPYKVAFRCAPLRKPPTIHRDPNTTHVVLAKDNAIYLLYCIVQQPDNGYIIEAFHSSDNAWYSCPQFEIPEGHGDIIVPNSGVGLGKAAYWLLRDSSDPTPTSVLCCDFGGDRDNSSIVSIVNLPRRPEGQARMQLGRAMGTLGLVIVNETNSTVSLFTLMPGPDNMWDRQELFSIRIFLPPEGLVADDVDEAVKEEALNSIASWRQEELTIVCREMPRPMRFDNFSVTLLFWIQGRVLKLENTADGTHEFRLDMVNDEDLPASIIDGVPHHCRT